MNWEYKTKYVLSQVDSSTVTTAQLEEIELDKMKFNAFEVVKEVADRVDGAIALDGYMTNFVRSTKDDLFYWDKKYLNDFIHRKPATVVQGHNYYSNLEGYSRRHVRTGDKYFEFVKFASKDFN